MISSTLFHGRISGGSLALGPTCVLMIRASKVPSWVGDHHDQGTLDVDYPDYEGRIAQLNALIDSGDTRSSRASTCAASSIVVPSLHGRLGLFRVGSLKEASVARLRGRMFGDGLRTATNFMAKELRSQLVNGGLGGTRRDCAPGLARRGLGGFGATLGDLIGWAITRRCLGYDRGRLSNGLGLGQGERDGAGGGSALGRRAFGTIAVLPRFTFLGVPATIVRYNSSSSKFHAVRRHPFFFCCVCVLKKT